MIKILTLNWNGKEKLEKLYPTLIQSLDGLDYEWYIKDNASEDDSVDFIKSIGNSNVNIIKYEHNNDTFSYGCNFLFKESGAKENDFVLLLNNDVIFGDKTSLKNMMSLFKDSKVGVVGAKLKFTGTNKLQHAGVIFDKILGFPKHFRANEFEDRHSSKNREFQAVTGAVLLTKAKYYKNICTSNKSGLCGLDEKFIWAFEDISACLSIKYNQNKKVVYCGNTDIFHDESFSLKKNGKNRIFMKQNLNHFKSLWKSKYIIDEKLYLSDVNYKLYK